MNAIWCIPLDIVLILALNHTCYYQCIFPSVEAFYHGSPVYFYVAVQRIFIAIISHIRFKMHKTTILTLYIYLLANRILNVVKKHCCLSVKSNINGQSDYRAVRQSRSGRTGGGLEWVVESTTVTHSSADWWDILLPLA